MRHIACHKKGIDETQMRVIKAPFIKEDVIHLHVINL